MKRDHRGSNIAGAWYRSSAFVLLLASAVLVPTPATTPRSSSLASTPATSSAQVPTQAVQPTAPAQSTQASPPPTPQTNTPEEAIMAYRQASGDTSQIVFKKSKYSASDPTWAYYDYQRFEGMEHFVFLVHRSGGLWSVVSMENNGPLSAADKGGPTDLTYP